MNEWQCETLISPVVDGRSDSKAAGHAVGRPLILAQTLVSSRYLGTVGLIGYATIDGTTSAAASSLLTHVLSSVLVATCVALWHA